MKVISRTSVMEYRDTIKKIPQIAKELGVANILEGGIQRSGNHVRINVQLIDAATDDHLWAETYNRELTAENLFAVQSEITRIIADVPYRPSFPQTSNVALTQGQRTICRPMKPICGAGN
jgi:TolB-like protein